VNCGGGTIAGGGGTYHPPIVIVTPPACSVCARVTLRIEQEAVMTRDAFRVLLDLSNPLLTPAQEVHADLILRDPSGALATPLFGIGSPVVSGLIGPSNNLVLLPAASGRLTWLVVPGPDAASNGPVVYTVSGTLTYRQDGFLVRIPLAPVAITVLPTARLQADYFLQRDVFSDDPFTAELESAEPFSLGVLVNNFGHGTARNLRIASAQPLIVENERGLIIDFDIIGTQVGNAPINPSLTVDFGNVASGETAVGRWLMTASLQGLFTDYKASFEHLDELGNPRLSLVERVALHEMIHLVSDDRPGADALFDFLVNDVPDERDLPDTLFLSHGNAEPVTALSQGSVTGTLAAGGGSLQLRLTNAPPGWVYLRLPDPGNGQYRLVRVERTNGVALPTENFWLTDRTFIGGGQRPIRENILHLVEHSAVGSYTLVYTRVSDATPPASQVNALTAASYPDFAVSWNGEDNEGGSGLASFDVYVATGANAFTLWLANTTLRGAIYHGELGRCYSFYSRATDFAGNREAAPGTPDAQTCAVLTNTSPSLVLATNLFFTNENEIFSARATAVDAEAPPQALTFSLVQAPAGARIDRDSGVITWPTGEAHGDSSNPFTVQVTDNGVPPMSAQKSFTVIVSDVNLPPILRAVPNQVVDVDKLLVVTNEAVDLDLPKQGVTFSLATSPAVGATISNGVVRWRPGKEWANSNVLFTVTATDTGRPPLSDSSSFTVFVTDYLALGAGRAVVRTNHSTNVLLTVYSSGGVSSLDFSLAWPCDKLTNVGLIPVSGVTFSLADPDGCSRRVTADLSDPGGLIGTADIGSIWVTGIATQSAFAFLELAQASAINLSGSNVPTVVTYAGRVVVVAREPLLEAERHANGGKFLTLYGIPGSSYQLLWTNALPRYRSGWPQAWRVGLSEPWETTEVVSDWPYLFFDAYEFTADPPLLEVQPPANQLLGDLLLFGIPKASYKIESTTDLSGQSGWGIFLPRVTLETSFQLIEGVVPSNPPRRFRAIRQP
jgi:hypothetical protein